MATYLVHVLGMWQGEIIEDKLEVEGNSEEATVGFAEQEFRDKYGLGQEVETVSEVYPVYEAERI